MHINSSSSRHDELVAAGFEAVCRTRDVPGTVPLRVVVGELGILVCRHLMRFYALHEVCPHRNAVMTHATLAGGAVQCPHHHYEFDLKTGECVRGKSEPIASYEVEVAAGTVYVRVPPKSDAEVAE